MELLEGWLQGEDEEWLFDSMTAILDLSFSASLKDYREEKLDLLDWLSNMWFKVTRFELPIPVKRRLKPIYTRCSESDLIKL